MTPGMLNSQEIKSDFNSKMLNIKALSHGAIFLATCNVILLLRDVNLFQMFGMLKIY